METVLVVEDISALRQHMLGLLREQVQGTFNLVEASNGEEGLRLFRSLSPTMVVTDISMPEMSGIKAAEQMWNENPRTKILFWSNYHHEAYVRKIGKIVPDEAIHGYVLKTESDEKLLYAINSVFLHDNPYIDPVVRAVQARVHCKDKSISDVEYEALLDIAIGLTDRAIAHRRHISVRGVQNRLSMLLSKLIGGEDAQLRAVAGMEIFNPRTRIVAEAMKRGLIDMSELPPIDQEMYDWLDADFGYGGLTTRS